nr:uncharacterized protein CFP56_57024 [Quercus suber]
MATILPPSRPRTVRRLSSKDATSDELGLRGPTIVAPPSLLDQPSAASEVAAAMEMARLEIEDADEEGLDPSTPTETTTTDKYAFAFDIDGVLIRGGRPIPEAIEAMQVLNGKNKFGIKMFVTVESK